MKTALYADEEPIRECRASLQRGVEVVGGWLFLTSERLVFEPHSLNIQREAVEIPLSEIEGTELRWVKVFGLIPLFPTVVAVKTRSGEEYEFMVFGRKRWADTIAKERARVA